MIRNIIISILSCLFVFSILELVSTFAVRRSKNALTVTRPILQVDPVLGWRQRANLDTTFLGHALRTNEWGWRADGVQSFERFGNGLESGPTPMTRPQILVLGPSSTFGWGVVRQDTFPDQLQDLLRPTRAKVINAGEIGFSTEQGRRLYDRPEVEQIKAICTIIAYGINDLDLSRFYFQSSLPDAEEFSRPKASGAYAGMNLVLQSALLSELFDIANQFTAWWRSNALPAGQAVRVPPPNFAANIEHLLDAVKDRGSRAILLTTVTNLRPVDAKSDQDREQLARIEAGVLLYNQILKRIAATRRVELLDLVPLFATRSAPELFVDPIHFSKAGHALVAQGLANLIAKSLSANHAQQDGEAQ